MPLILPANVREHFPPLTGTAEDPLLSSLVDRADALMAAFCGWPIPDAGSPTLTSATYTRYYDGPSLDQPSRLDLGHPWVTAYTSAAVDSAGDWSYATVIPGSDLVLDTVGDALWLKPTSAYVWYTSPRANKVVYSGGFATTPPDLIATTAMAVRHLLQLRRVNLGDRSSSVNGNFVSRDALDELLPEAVRQALSLYVNWASRVG